MKTPDAHFHTALEYLALSVATGLTLLLRGYAFAVTNHSFYIPIIYKLQQPTLFPNDIMLNVQLNTFFFPLMALLLNTVSLEILFFGLYVLFTVLYTHSVYLLARTISGSRSAAFLAVLLLVIPKSSFGGADSTATDAFLYNTASIPLCLYAVHFYLRRQYVIAFSILGVVFNFHALYPIFLVSVIGIAVALQLCDRTGRADDKPIYRDKNFLYGVVVFALATLPLFILRQSSSPDIDDTAVWFLVTRARSSFHLFPDMWNFVNDFTWPLVLIVAGFLSSMLIAPRVEGRTNQARVFVCLGILALAYFGARLSASLVVTAGLNLLLYGAVIVFAALAIVRPPVTNRIHYTVRTFFFGFGLLLIAAYLFSAVWPLRTVATLQLFRSTIFLMILCIIYIAGMLDHALRTGTAFWRLIACVWFVFVFYNGEKRLLPAVPPIEYPWKTVSNSWVDVQRWARESTSESSSFIVPIDTEGFRIYSLRSIYTDWKDGTFAVFSSSFAREWLQRLREIDGSMLDSAFLANRYNQMTESDFVRLGKKYRQDYVVVRAGHELMFVKVYANPDFAVYKLPSW